MRKTWTEDSLRCFHFRLSLEERCPLFCRDCPSFFRRRHFLILKRRGKVFRSNHYQSNTASIGRTRTRFLGATKHLYNWLRPLVGWSVGWLVGNDDPHVAPYWPTWPCSIIVCGSFECVNMQKVFWWNHRYQTFLFYKILFIFCFFFKTFFYMLICILLYWWCCISIIACKHNHV